MNGLDLDIYRGEVLGFVGGSGTGKSVLTRTILGLIEKQSGTIETFGENADAMTDVERRAIERRWGVMFQQGALFSGPDGKAEHPGPDARISAPLTKPDGRTRSA